MKEGGISVAPVPTITLNSGEKHIYQITTDRLFSLLFTVPRPPALTRRISLSPTHMIFAGIACINEIIEQHLHEYEQA